MAQLIWKDVDGPRFDMQGLAVNADVVSRSLSRLGDGMIAMEEKNRQQATDAAIANAMATQDPDAVRNLLMQGPAGLGKRVNARDYMTALGAHQNQLMETNKNREEMLNLQAFAQMGDEQAHYVGLLGQGKRDEANAFAAQMAQQNPDLWGRVAYGTQKDGEGVFDNWDNRRLAGERDAESARHNKAGEGLEAQRNSFEGARLQLAREQHALEMQDRRDQRAGTLAAQSFATKYRLMDTESAEKLLYEDKDFKSLSPIQQDAVLARFGKVHGALTGATSQEADGFRAMDSRIATATNALTGMGNVAENQQSDPLLSAVRASRANEGKLTANQVAANMQKLGPYWTEGTAKTELDQMLADNPKATPADVQAAIDQFGLSHNWFSNAFGGSNEDDMLRKNVKDIVDKRLAGYGQNLEIDVANARAPSASAQAEITRLRAELTRYSRANQTPPQAKIDRLNTLLSKYAPAK